MRRLWFLSLFAMIGVLSCGSSALGQVSSAAPRISGSVDESSLTILKGNVPSKAKAQFDQGSVAGSTQLTHVRLVLARSIDQQAALDKYSAELQDKSSPNYHKWLTPQQFGTMYGPADSDLAAVVGWLESHGLKLEEVSPGRTNIAFSGTVSQLEGAFHTSIHSFNADGEAFVSNVIDPSIPSALSSVVMGVAHLNTIRPTPHHLSAGMGKFDPGLNRLVPAAGQSSAGPTPQLTTGGAGSFFLYLVPGDAATIYDTPNSFNANNSATGLGYTGLNVTIGIGGDSPILPTTVVNFRNRFLGDPTPPTITNVDGVTDTTNADEAYIDTELSGGVAPGATIHFYTSNDLVSAIEKAINDNKVDIFSLSFGSCELAMTTAQNALVNGWWQQAATQGIAVTVSTGDNGSAGCDDPSTVFSAIQGLQVSGFASTPFNVAVGGTDFAALSKAFATYASATSQKGSFYRTALSYIPESTWTDAVVTDGTISSNVPFLDSTGNSQIAAGSGGVSACSTNTGTATTVGTCSSGYAKPLWQHGTGVPADGARDLPDVSLMSGNGVDSAAWLVCTDGTGVVGGVSVTTDCTTQSSNLFYFAGYGGTSTAAPAFAGILAMVQQKTGGRLGQASKVLYDLYNGSHAAAVFHDVTVGNISVPCTTGKPNCTKNTAGNYFLTGYDAAAGYDLATGLGSVDATQLVNYWGTAIGNGDSTVTVTPSLITLTTAQSLNVTVSVTGTLGTITGTVTLTGGGYTSAAQTISSGSVTFTIAAAALAQGADTLTATYSGDATYGPKTGTATVTVSGLIPTVHVDPSATTLNSNTPLTVTVEVTGGADATPAGTVTLSGGGYTSAAQTLSNGAFAFTIPANSLNGGADVLTVTYSGDATYATASNSTVVTVTRSAFTLSATDVTLAAGATSSNISTVTATPVGGYTGTVTLTAAVTASPSGAVSAPTLTGSTLQLSGVTPAAGTITVGTTAAPASIRASRSDGAGWFRAAGGTAIAALLFFFLPIGSRRYRKMLSAMLLMCAVSFAGVGCGGGSGGGGGTTTPAKTTPTVTVTAAKASIFVTDSLSVSITVAGSGAVPTGSVTLSSGTFKSAATSLTGGAGTIVIPANSLAVGATDSLAVSYSGDANFNVATGSASVAVTQPRTTAGLYTVTVTGKGNDPTASTATTTFTLTVN